MHMAILFHVVINCESRSYLESLADKLLCVAHRPQVGFQFGPFADVDLAGVAGDGERALMCMSLLHDASQGCFFFF